MIVVVDASVAVKWFLPEARSDIAARLLTSAHVLLAPELMRLEVGNSLLRAVRRGMIAQEIAIEAMERLSPPRLRFEPTGEIADAAFKLAGQWGGTVYDALYVLIAGSVGAVVATDDHELSRTARRAGIGEWLISEQPPVTLEFET